MSYLRDIAVFVRVVDLQGFAAAGRALGLTAPSVSKQIARLEAALGVALLHRTTHNLFLTDAGKEFYDRCVRGLAELESARAAALSFNDELRGKLRVHATLMLGQTLVAPAIIDFMAEHPDIRIDLDFGSIAVNLMETQIDVAVRFKTQREKGPGHIGIGRRILGNSSQALVASPDYLARSKRLERIEDIPIEECLLCTTATTFTNQWAFQRDGREIVLKIDRPHLHSNNWLVIRGAALKGLGIARLPEFAVRDDIASGALVSLFPDQVHSDFQVQAVFPRTQRMPAKTRLLLDFLAQRLSSLEASLHAGRTDIAPRERVEKPERFVKPKADRKVRQA